ASSIRSQALISWIERKLAASASSAPLTPSPSPRNTMPDPMGIGLTAIVVAPTRSLKSVGPERMLIFATLSPSVRATTAVRATKMTLIAVSDAPIMNADPPSVMRYGYIAVQFVLIVERVLGPVAASASTGRGRKN